MSSNRPLAIVLLLVAAVSCRPDDQRTDSVTAEKAMQARAALPAEVVAQLDSGNAAFRVKDHKGALAHYTRATELAPDEAAGWYGVYMAQLALGNEEAAQAALAKAQSANPGATLLKPAKADTIR